MFIIINFAVSVTVSGQRHSGLKTVQAGNWLCMLQLHRVLLEIPCVPPYHLYGYPLQAPLSEVVRVSKLLKNKSHTLTELRNKQATNVTVMHLPTVNSESIFTIRNCQQVSHTDQVAK